MGLDWYVEIIFHSLSHTPEMNPSLVVNYVYSLAKIFNSFYSEHSVSRAETEEKKQLRLRICVMTANIIHSSMSLLGIKVPERM